MIPFLHGLENYTKKVSSHSGVHFEKLSVLIAGLVILFISLALFPKMVLPAVSLALFLSPLWLSALVVSAAWFMWITLKRGEFIAKQNYLLLEIKPPRNLEKTPLAMEAVISGIHLDPGESNWYKEYLQGAVRPYFSLEIASFEGQVHFFIWTRVGFRRAIETSIYAQYPGAQVVEVPDYTQTISAKPEEWEIWGCDFKHSRPDSYPIKTYVDYGLDKVQKEPEQVDPLANVIEFMGAFGKGEYFWLQFIVRVHKGEKYKKLTADGKAFTWKNEATEKVDEIRKLAQRKSTYTDPVTGKVVISEGFPNPTKGQQELIAAIERNVAKLGFDTGIRAIYMARPGHFSGTTIASIKGLFKAFSSETHNDITWNTSRGLLKFEDYPWEINVEKRKNKVRRKLVDAFRRRQFFHSPYPNTDYMVMSTEELATVFHIPSYAVETPGLPRIQSATSTAPANLPI